MVGVMEVVAVAMAVQSVVSRRMVRKVHGVHTGAIIRIVVEQRARTGATFYKVNLVSHPITIRRGDSGGALPISLPHLLSFVLEPVISCK
jgi:hypothetical protein